MPQTKIHGDDAEGADFIEPGEMLDNPPYTWVYADSTAREAATGFVEADIGKLARQSDENSLWMLVGYSPTEWKAMGGTGHSRGHSLHDPLDHTNVEGTPEDGQALVYDAEAAKWKPGAVASADVLYTTEGGVVYDNNDDLVLRG